VNDVPASAVALIPARHGSKRVPGKNVRRLGLHPVLAYTIAPAIESGVFDSVIVSTDSEETAAIARHYGAEVPFLRPAALAADDTPDLPVFQHALGALREREGWVPDLVVHLRPTQPLRRARDIDEVVTLWERERPDCVKSVRPVSEHPFKMYRLVGGRLVPYLQTDERRRRGPDVPRQSLEPLYLSAGVVDAMRREIVEHGTTEGAVVIPYFADPARYVNLDSARDFEIAEALLAALGGEEER